MKANLVFSLFALTIGGSDGFLTPPFRGTWGVLSTRETTATFLNSESTKSISLESIGEQLSNALDEKEMTRTCKVKVAPVNGENLRLGLVATKAISKGEACLSMPYDDRYELRPDLAQKNVFGEYLGGDKYESWTGDAGLIALLVLNEVAKAAEGDGGVPTKDGPKRDKSIDDFMKIWVNSLPGPTEFDHPLLWSEEDQEVLQSSSTNKIYRLLDDLEEDAIWLTENVFSKDRTMFPETVLRNGETFECFSVDGYRWAMAIAQSRSFFLNGKLRLIPFLDMCNHNDDCEEIRDGTMGTFGTTKGSVLVATENYKPGDQVFCSYGPKSAADYLLEHGFVPEQCWNTAVSELTFELDPDDRFYDDKLDILEFETYDQAPMDPVQSFDAISAPGRDGQPDPAMVQFLRLCKLGKTDAFLLESIFRKEVWDFMSLPVSETNEIDVINEIIEVIQRALDDFAQCPEGGPEVCTRLRESEKKALTRTKEFLEREREALDLKEYYQERRLKDLGLDSQWSPEDDMMDPDVSFGQTRKPGGADYDW